MSLIKCPECGKEISDKATTCINCGYPINEIKSETIQPPAYNCPICKSNNWILNDDKTVFVCQHCKYETRAKKTNENNDRIFIHKNTPTCPKCGSTAITAGQRGFSLLTGFLGSNKTVNRCANCGHTWKP